MWNVGDSGYMFVYSLPNHPLTQLPGVGRGDATYRDGNKYAVTIRPVTVMTVDRWNGHARVHCPGVWVFENGAWGPPKNRRGEEEKVTWVLPLTMIYNTPEEAQSASYDLMGSY